MKNKISWTQKKADILIGIVAVTWGISYVLMKLGLEGITPFNLIFLRFGIAFPILLIIFRKQLKNTTLSLLGVSMLLGLLLFIFFALLMFGLQRTPASITGFLSNATVIFIPLIERIAFHKKQGKKMKIKLFFALLGIFLMSVNSMDLSLGLGVFYCLLSALSNAIHVLLTDKFTVTYDSTLIGIYQIGFAGLLGLIFMLLFESAALPQTSLQWFSVLGLAFVCTAFGYVAVPIAQKYTTPEHTGLLYSLEPVFSAIFGWCILSEIMTPWNIVGVILIILCVI